MSRLDEALLGLDRTRRAAVTVGAIPTLREAKTRARWPRILGPVAVVALVLAGAVAIVMRPPAPAAVQRTATAGVKPAAPTAPAPTSAPVERPELAARRLMGQGLEAAREGAFEQAAGQFERALALNPGDAAGWNNLGVAQTRAGQTAKGIDAFHRAVRLRPSYPEAHLNLAVALERQGRPREAAASYKAFLAAGGDRHPDGADARRRVNDLAGGSEVER